MKKICFIAVLLLICVSFSFAQKEVKTSTMSYVNVPILKIVDHPQYYIITYRKNGLDLGQTSVPKEWFKQGSSEKKGKFRNIVGNSNSYITLWFNDQDDSFEYIYINLTTNALDDIWGVTHASQKIPAEIDPKKVAAGL